MGGTGSCRRARIGRRHEHAGPPRRPARFSHRPRDARDLKPARCRCVGACAPCRRSHHGAARRERPRRAAIRPRGRATGRAGRLPQARALVRRRAVSWPHDQHSPCPAARLRRPRDVRPPRARGGAREWCQRIGRDGTLRRRSIRSRSDYRPREGPRAKGRYRRNPCGTRPGSRTSVAAESGPRSRSEDFVNLLLFILALQNPESLSVRFAGMTAVTGFEQAMGDSILALLPGSTRDRLGNVTLTLGRGAPKRLLNCSLDEIGYAIGNITDDGYITLRRVGGGPRLSPLFDQQMEGQRVTLFGRRGAAPGVVAVRSTHLTRGRPTGNEAPFTVDNTYVDVGATSRDDVIALGLGVLTPVSLTKQPHRYGDRLLAAPYAGRRAACAALAAAVLSKPRVRGTVVVAFTVQSLYADTAGLKTVQNLQGPFEVTRMVTLVSLYRETAVETVALRDVDALVADLVRWIGGGQ